MKQKKIIRCPYCGGTAILRDASFVYGEKSYGGKVYVCSNYPRCDAYVGSPSRNPDPQRHTGRPGTSEETDAGTSDL